MIPGQLSTLGEPPPEPPPDWPRAARRAVWDLCKRSRTFTPDDVWHMIGTLNGAPQEPRALGPILVYAKHRGWCEPTGEHVQSTRRRGVCRVWRSLVRP